MSIINSGEAYVVFCLRSVSGTKKVTRNALQAETKKGELQFTFSNRPSIDAIPFMQLFTRNQATNGTRLVVNQSGCS